MITMDELLVVSLSKNKTVLKLERFLLYVMLTNVFMASF